MMIMGGKYDHGVLMRGRYACDALRNLKNNLHTSDYIKKLAAFFEYARHDPDMVSFSCHWHWVDSTLNR